MLLRAARIAHRDHPVSPPIVHTPSMARGGTVATSSRRNGIPAALANPHTLLIRLSLALALAFGFSLGLYLVVGFAFGLPLAASTPALIQLHGQVQALGFVAMFIMAVG